MTTDITAAAPAAYDGPRFVNALRILCSIDRHELTEAGVPMGDEQWNAFRRNPVAVLVHSDEERIARIWSIIERRQPKR